MFITELFEAVNEKNLVVIYPGRFQPWHKGHKAVYDGLCKKYGTNNVWITTSNKVELPRSPFNFQEKLAMMSATGVDASRVVQSVQPYRPEEILGQYDPNTTVVLFAVSEKDMAGDPRFSFQPRRDGSPSYFQPAPASLAQASPLSQAGYIKTVPIVDFTVLGQPMQGATEVRSQFAQADEQTRKSIIKDLFGTYNDQLYTIMASKLAEDAAGVGVVAGNKKMAKDPRYSTSMTVDVHPDTPRKNAQAFGLV